MSRLARSGCGVRVVYEPMHICRFYSVSVTVADGMRTRGGTTYSQARYHRDHCPNCQHDAKHATLSSMGCASVQFHGSSALTHWLHQVSCCDNPHFNFPKTTSQVLCVELTTRAGLLEATGDWQIGAYNLPPEDPAAMSRIEPHVVQTLDSRSWAIGAFGGFDAREADIKGLRNRSKSKLLSETAAFTCVSGGQISPRLGCPNTSGRFPESLAQRCTQGSNQAHAQALKRRSHNDDHGQVGL